MLIGHIVVVKSSLAGMTAFFHATEFEQLEIMSLLLEHGEDIDRHENINEFSYARRAACYTLSWLTPIRRSSQ